MPRYEVWVTEHNHATWTVEADSPEAILAGNYKEIGIEVIDQAAPSEITEIVLIGPRRREGA